MVLPDVVGLSRFKITLDGVLPLAKLALKKRAFVLHQTAQTSPCACNDFDCRLIGAWRNVMDSGVFNYNLDVQYKLLPGAHELVAQLNVDRGAKRRPPHHFEELYESFNDAVFNFTKIKSSEVLVEIEEDNDCEKSYIVINISPIEVGHSLLVPRLNRRLPQYLVPDELEVAVKLFLNSRCTNFHLVYNSLLACASVNHLHFHLYYLDYPLKLQEATATELVPGALYLVRDWLFPTLAFQLTTGDLQQFVHKFVMGAVRVLQRRKLAHNFFMTRALRLTRDTDNEAQTCDALMFPTLFLFARRNVSGAKPSAGFSPAACELAGHILVYNKENFADMSEENICQLYSSEVRLSEELFHSVVQEIIREFV